MLTLVLCLLGQFAPETAHPTVDEYRARRIAEIKADAEARRPSKKMLATLPRSKTQVLIKEINSTLKAMENAERTKAFVEPGTVLINTITAGQMGRPVQKETSSRTATVGGKRVTIIDEKIAPAQFKVVQTLTKDILICRCWGKEFVYRNYTGPAIPDNSSITPAEVVIASGTYRFPDGETLLASSRGAPVHLRG